MEVNLTLFGPELAPTTRESGCSPKARDKKEVFEDYEGFVEKFKKNNVKMTTDECYTPAAIFDAVLDFVQQFYDLSNKTVVRPFFPGGDFINHPYTEDSVVIDNPPFSILSKIVRFYVANNIPFFLFGPTLSLFTARECDVTYVITDSDIRYENGAIVNTGFITNLCPGLRIWVCPQLHDAIVKETNTTVNRKRKILYPDNVVTSATLSKYASKHVELKISSMSCYPVGNIDSARLAGSGIFGGGFILSDRAAKQRAAAELAAKKHDDGGGRSLVLVLSPREQRIVDMLNKQDSIEYETQNN